MDNGVGVVDGAALVGRPSESKIDGEFPSDVSGLRDSEGDEDFEEAEEASLDDDAHSLKETNDAIASMSSHVTVEGVSNIFGDDGMLLEQHEDAVMEDAMEVPAADENEGHSLGGDNSNGVTVATVNDNGGIENKVITVDDKGRIGNEDSAEEQRVAASIKHKETSFEERGASQQEDDESGDAVPVEELMADEKLQEGDAEEICHSEPDADQLRTSDVTIAHELIDDIDGELPSKASPDNLSGDQNHIGCEDGLAGTRKNSGSMDVEEAVIASDAPQQNGAISLDASDSFNANHCVNGEHNPAPSEQKEGDREPEDTVHEETTPVESEIPASKAQTSNASGYSTISENKEHEGLVRQYATDLAQSGHDDVHNSSASAAAVVKGGEATHRDLLSGQASRENEPNPESTSVSSPSAEKSEKPVLRPAGLGRTAALLEHAPKETEMKPTSTTVTSSSVEKSPSPVLRPAGLGSAAAILKPAPGETEPKPASTSGSSSLMGKSQNVGLRPAGLGRAAPLLEPGSRVVQQPRSNGAASQLQSQLAEDMGNGEVEEGDETREKLQMIRVKFLRLAHRLGQTPHNVVVAQVLYRLGLAEQLRGRTGGRTGGAFSYDRASAMAEQLEQTGKEPLDFSCTIMVLGKTGVGKSATINSIFDEVKFSTDAFSLGTKKVQDVEGTVQGIKVRIIDTPGLLSSWSEQRKNEKILHSVKQFIKKTPPDIVLYLDRLDMASRDFGDMPLLRTITDIFGPSIWFNAIVVLTHAASAPPEGPNGTATTYDMFVTQRSHAVQQAIRQAAGDMRLMNPVSLVENHSACRTNRAGQRVLPNGQVWKPHLLLLSFASKILAEANALLKLQDTPPGKPFPARSRAPPLPFLLSSLLQSRSQLKLPDEQFGEDDAFDEDLDDSSGSDEESEYDELPPFRRLTKAQLAKLTKEQRREYNDELEYRERLFMKKQLKEEKRRRKMMKKMAEAAKDLPGEDGENMEEESSGAASVPVPMPDLALPASFDADNPTHRYRYLDSSNQWLVRPVLDAHGWDHDVGYEGINVERLFVVKEKVPVSFSGQVSKDKKEATLQMEVASSIKHGEGKGTTMGFDMQSVGKDMAYTLRSETRFSNYKHNKATAGLSFTLLGDAMTAGLKVEDKLIVNKQFRMVMSGGAMTGRGDTAYGGSLEATLRDKDYPLGRFHSSLGLSVMDWHGDLAIGCNIQSQIPVGRSTNLVARANLNNRGSGQVSLRLNSSEQIQLALIGLIPLVKKVMGQYSSQQY